MQDSNNKDKASTAALEIVRRRRMEEAQYQQFAVSLKELPVMKVSKTYSDSEKRLIELITKCFSIDFVLGSPFTEIISVF